MSAATAFPETKAAKQLVGRYMAQWNEPDAARRRQLIAELWAEDARHLLQPPQEIRELAAQPGVGLPAILEARGHAEIEARITSAQEHWVGGEGLSFRGRDDVERLGDVVKFHWEAVTGDGEVAAVGLDLLVLGASGRIERTYTFVEG